MTEEQGIAFLTALRAKNIRVKDNGWIEASCPLAPWLHQKHHDHSPSFGLNATTSYFWCFACRQGSAEELLHTVELYSKGKGDYDFGQCHQLLLEDVPVVMPLPPFGEFTQVRQPFVEWPQFWVESFTQAAWVTEAAVYLASRGVPVQQLAEFDLRYDPKRSMIVAPYRDVFGRLAGARGRSILDTGQKHYDYTFQNINNARWVWYNEKALNLHGPVVVVEGQFDLWRTVQAFPKTVASLTSKPTVEKMKKLGGCGVVIQIPDRDAAGSQSTVRYAELCQQFGLQHRILWLDEGVKDPAECSIDYLRDRIHDLL